MTKQIDARERSRLVTDEAKQSIRARNIPVRQARESAITLMVELGSGNAVFHLLAISCGMVARSAVAENPADTGMYLAKQHFLHEGLKGVPGMRETSGTIRAVVGRGLGGEVTWAADGHFSRGGGSVVGHIACGAGCQSHDPHAKLGVPAKAKYAGLACRARAGAVTQLANRMNS